MMLFQIRLNNVINVKWSWTELNQGESVLPINYSYINFQKTEIHVFWFILLC